MSGRKWLFAMAALIALGAAGAYVYWSNQESVQYTTARVLRGDLESTISATGSCNAVVMVQVGSQVSGNIKELHADFNTKVKKGQLVALIDPAVFQARVDQTQSNLESARSSVVSARAQIKKVEADVAASRANIANQKANVVRARSAVADAKNKLARREEMLQQGILSREDRDSAQAVYDQAMAGLEAAEAQLVSAQSNLEAALAQQDVAQTQLISAESSVKQNQASVQQAMLDLEHTRITAPVDGTVIARNMDVGQTVAASFSAPTLFQIAQDLTKMQVDTNVDESDISRVQLNQTATFTVDAYPGTVFQGLVQQIRKAPLNVQNVISYDVVVRIDNEDLKLFPGMTANVRILVEKASGVLKIPAAALRFRLSEAGAPAAKQKGGAATGGKNRPVEQTIYVLGTDRKPRPERVRLGIGDGNFVALAAGNITEGDLVITGYAAGQSTTPATAPGQTQQVKGRGMF